MGLFDSLPNPLDFGSKGSDSFLPGLPSFNVDLTNPLDSLMAGKNGSSSGDRSGGTGGPLDMFGSLSLDFADPFSMLGGSSDSKRGGGSSSPLSSLTNPFELAKQGGSPSFVDGLFPGNFTELFGGASSDSSKNDSSSENASFLDGLFGAGDLDFTDLFGGSRPGNDVWSPEDSWDGGARLNGGDEVWAPHESWDLNTRMYDPTATTSDISYPADAGFDRNLRPGEQNYSRMSMEMLASMKETLSQILDLLEAQLMGSNSTTNGGSTRPTRPAAPQPQRPETGDDCGCEDNKGGTDRSPRQDNTDRTPVRDNSDRGGDTTIPKHDGPVVRVDSSEQLENLKIEPGMQVQLKPGAHYQIDKGLRLPEGASIVGDKNNPPTIDYIGGDKNFPNIVNVTGKDAVIQGVNFESSLAKPGAKGGASGIRVSEAGDNLIIKDCTAGTIASFIHIDGADNVTIDGCSAKEVNSYFVWNEKGSDGTTIKNSSCEDSRLEWVVRSYGDDLSIENSHIENKSRKGDPNKGALAIYDGSNASIKDSTIAGGIRLGPLTGEIHGAQYVDPENNERLKPGLSQEEQAKARRMLSAVVDGVHAEGNRIEGWVQFSQNSKNVLFENNDIIASGSNGSFATFTALDGRYRGFRDPAEGVLRNNRFSGDVKLALSNPSGSKVRLAEGNTLNGRKI